MQRILLALLFFGGMPAMAQTVTIQASCLGGCNSKVQSGVITFTPHLQDGSAASATLANGGGVITKLPLTATVSNGSFTLPYVAATDTSSPQHFCYPATVKNTAGQLLGAGLSCVQPESNNATWCSNGVCNFDKVPLNLPAQAVQTQGPIGSRGPGGPADPGGSITANGSNGTFKVGSTGLPDFATDPNPNSYSSQDPSLWVSHAFTDGDIPPGTPSRAGVHAWPRPEQYD